MELWNKMQCHTPLGSLAVAAPIKPRCLGRNCSQCCKLQSLISGGTLCVCLSLSSSPMCVMCIWVCCAHDCAGANANTHSSRGQRKNLDGFLYHLVSYSCKTGSLTAWDSCLRQGLSLQGKLTVLTRLAGQLAPRIQLPCLNAAVADTHSHAGLFLRGC